MNKWKVATALAAGIAIVGGGAAFAAQKLSTPSSDNQAVINDAAKRLNVTPSALSNALKKALEDRIDAAVTAGRITKAQGDALKARIEAGTVPFFHGGRGFGDHRFGVLSAAATYLGMTPADLRSALESGKTLAQVAQSKGKPVSGLVDAMVADARMHLDAAVSAGRITSAEEQKILSDLRQRMTGLVNGVSPSGTPSFGFHRDFF